MSGDRDTFFWLGQLDKASCVMTVGAGIAPHDVGARFAAALRTVLADGERPGAERPTDYLGFQPLLHALCGADDASRIHVGRSRQDILATVYRLILRDETTAVRRELDALRTLLVDLAGTYARAVVPAYTNGVQAQPVTFGHLLLGYESTLARSARRWAEFAGRCNECPLGVAAMATSSFPVDRARLAALLGFDGVVDNSFDAGQLSAIDVGFEAAAAAMGTALSLGTFVQDVHAQYHHSRPWIVLDEGALTAPSTMMPQKINPVALNRARLLASEVLGDGTSTAFAAHNVCSGLTDYKRAESQRTVRRAADLLAEVSSIVASMRLDEDTALREVRGDWSSTSELANTLQREHDVAFAVGHAFAGALTRVGRAAGAGPDGIGYDEARRVYREVAGDRGAGPPELPLDEDAFRAALDPRRMVDSYRGSGGPQEAEVNRMLAAARERIALDSARLARETDALAAAEDTLEREFLRLADAAS